MIFLFALCVHQLWWPADQLITNADVVGNTLYGYFRPGSLEYGISEEAVKKLVGENSYYYLEQSQLQISKVLEGNPNFPLILYIHAGSFVDGNRFQIGSGVLTLARAADLTLLSMDYTKFIDANDDPFLDVRMAISMVRQTFKQKVFLIGNSAGGLLASYAAAYSLADYVLLMNPVTCIDTWFDDFDATPELCKSARNTKVVRSLTGRGLCYTNYSFAIPVYLVFPANDWIVPRSQWTKLISTLPSCADDFGFHGNAMTYVGGCFSPIAKWMKAAMNVDVSLYNYAWHAFLDELRYVTQRTIFLVTSKDVYCKNTCLAQYNDATAWSC